jgi:Tellurite resistance protein TerB
MAFADGAVSEFEDNMMWRVADLLAVSPRDRIALRQQAADQARSGRRVAGGEANEAET